MYHSVDDNSKFFTISRNDFERQMAYLAGKGYHVVPLPHLVSMIKRRKSVAGCVALTFDDGYEDFYTNAIPILQKYKLPATVFLATGLIGKTYNTVDGEELSMMNKETALRVCKEKDIYCMPHTVTHPNLRDISLEESIREIESSRIDVEGISKREARVFAYPKGRYTQKIINYLRNKNWDAAVTVNPGLVHMNSDIFSLSRNAVDSSTSFTQFKGKVSGAITLYTKLRSLFRMNP